MPIAPFLAYDERCLLATYKDAVGQRQTAAVRSAEDVTPDIASLGAPIFDYTGSVRAALSIGGLKSLLLGADRETFTRLVVEGAREISAALGYEAKAGSSTTFIAPSR